MLEKELLGRLPVLLPFSSSGQIQLTRALQGFKAQAKAVMPMNVQILFLGIYIGHKSFFLNI